MLTGQADAAAVRRAEEHAGLFACLYKPMAGNELADVVSAALAQLENPSDE
jgi:FixJ family two-component response regulator